MKVGNELVKINGLYKLENRYWADRDRTFNIPRTMGFKILEKPNRKQIWIEKLKKFIICTERDVVYFSRSL